MPCFSVAFPCFTPGSVEDMKPIDWEGVSSLNVLMCYDNNGCNVGSGPKRHL